MPRRRRQRACVPGVSASGHDQRRTRKGGAMTCSRCHELPHVVSYPMPLCVECAENDLVGLAAQVAIAEAALLQTERERDAALVKLARVEENERVIEIV